MILTPGRVACVKELECVFEGICDIEQPSVFCEEQEKRPALAGKGCRIPGALAEIAHPAGGGVTCGHARNRHFFRNVPRALTAVSEKSENTPSTPSLKNCMYSASGSPLYSGAR